MDVNTRFAWTIHDDLASHQSPSQQKPSLFVFFWQNSRTEVLTLVNEFLSLYFLLFTVYIQTTRNTNFINGRQGAECRVESCKQSFGLNGFFVFFFFFGTLIYSTDI